MDELTRLMHELDYPPSAENSAWEIVGKFAVVRHYKVTKLQKRRRYIPIVEILEKINDFTYLVSFDNDGPQFKAWTYPRMVMTRQMVDECWYFFRTYSAAQKAVNEFG